MRFDEIGPDVMDTLEARLMTELTDDPCLERSAQRLCSMLYDGFTDSTVLVRAFVTVPHGRLPPAHQAFVRRTLRQRGEAPPVDATPVLTLLGTRGLEPDWNDRKLSRGHVGIPLASPELVDKAPMIASLMKQLGTWAWDDAGALGTEIVTQSIGAVAGVFYVEDARSAVDARGRKIIAAEDFVERYAVRTVFGFGGAYALRGTFVAVVVFTRDYVARAEAERFMRLANTFKAVTMRAAMRRRVFEEHVA